MAKWYEGCTSASRAGWADLLPIADRFEWGSVATSVEREQLAASILAEHLADVQYGATIALNLHEHFERDVICRLPHNKWTLAAEAIDQWLWTKHGFVRTKVRPELV